MAAVPVAGVLDLILFANKRGASVGFARSCDSWLACCQDSLDQGGIVRGDFLCLLTQQPKISHVHGLRPLPLDGIIYDAYRRRVVDVDGGGRLRVVHLFQCEADDSGVHGVEEEGSQFGFSCRGSYTLEDCALC